MKILKRALAILTTIFCLITLSSVVKADNQDVLDQANVLDYKT